MTDNFQKGLDQGIEEYKGIYKSMRFIKSREDRISACNMVMMRARDIEREMNKPDGYPEFTFTISTYDPENQKWLRCPGCGNDDINKVSDNGNEWQGCYKCHVLLGKFGTIKSMSSQKKKVE